MNLLGSLYGRATELRRAWYEGRPGRVRRLHRPVISIGNLVVGGSGKTPIAAAIARLLRESGERPSILSRGYGRRASPAGVVVVSDGERVLAGPAESGDEPLMLARALSGVPVLVSPDRHLSGSLAETRFDCSVHLLDDGFQHVQLARDIDLLVMSPADLRERLLPAGTLREPIAAAHRADALIVNGSDSEASDVAARVALARVFRASPAYGAVRAVGGGASLDEGVGRRALAVAAIARPERFFTALRDLGWDVACTMAYRDHHWFSAGDLQAVRDRAVQHGVDVVITTEKDAVRLPARAGTGPPPWAVLPLEMVLEPRAELGRWLSERLAAVRQASADLERSDRP